jgi:hypothetical protein
MTLSPELFGICIKQLTLNRDKWDNFAGAISPIAWLRSSVRQCDGGPLCRIVYLETVDWRLRTPKHKQFAMDPADSERTRMPVAGIMSVTRVSGFPSISASLH